MQRIEELRSLLTRANEAYFGDTAPFMPDREYDTLLEELGTLESAHPELDDAHSPTRRVGGGLVTGFESVPHAVPMQSIDNSYALDDVRAWAQRVAGTLGDAPFTCFADPKIDGVAMSVRYVKGRFAQAITRGDGVKGDDITAQAKRITCLPMRLSKPVTVEIRGEAFIDDDTFVRVNQERTRDGDAEFMNARNTTAGTLKSLQTDLVAERGVRFLMHGRGDGDTLGATTWSDFVQASGDLGLPVSTMGQAFSDLDDLCAHLENFATQRSALGFGVDGMVVRVDDFAQQAQLGSTSKSPRWCVAYKYPAEQKQTTLLDVQWQVGRNGTLTPRATLKTVKIAGTNVSHATLHNIEEIQRKDLRIGDSVWVEKAGEIIPQVLGPVEGARSGGETQIEAPSACPACGGLVEREGPKLYCVSPECPRQLRERLAWYVGRGQMDIDGLGDRLVHELAESGLVRTVADLYALTASDLARLEGLAGPSAQKLVESIEASKSQGLERVLAAVGLRHVGRTGARTLAGAFDDWAALAKADVDQLAELDDIGAVIAASVVNVLHSTEGLAMFEALELAGVDLTSAADQRQQDSWFAGKRIVLTGTLEQFKRLELTRLLEGLGASVGSSVGPTTDLLIAGDKAGSKLAKAETLGIAVWDEATLVDQLAGRE